MTSSSSALGLTMSVKLAPLLIGTFVRHYLDRALVTKDSKAREELIYDEMFNVVKSFLETSTKFTVEELQAFSNTRIPAPPWVRTITVRIPLSSCDAAADSLIQALGGPEVARKVAGGTRWWQVRSLHGIDGEWIMVKKDVDEKRKRRKAEFKRAQAEGGSAKKPEIEQEPHEYPKEMDGSRCMLYVHGGGYYFGSIDQQRFCLHRYARKMNGRVFAMNYRLAPQYPFPCALQDALAAYLYLIDPPPGALHAKVDPSLIICAGDSAGGGAVLALLQVIRDSGLPAPAGAILISPWCDLTHSFPSLHQNVDSDIIPTHGLCLHKPSSLWPPPGTDITLKLRTTLSSKVKDAVRKGMHAFSDIGAEDKEPVATTSKIHQSSIREADNGGKHEGKKSSEVKDPITNDISENMLGGETLHPENALPIPRNFAVPADQFSVLLDGNKVDVNTQIQFYALNSQLLHPLVSPALGYLGGLPPCLFIISDKEVLRDEIIYTAHKAAHPERYPVKDGTRSLYPPLNGIETRYGPTNVHIQVYDETCHVLPLYSFCTPAKYCYRAIATFCKYVVPPKGRPSLDPTKPSQVWIPVLTSPSEEIVGASDKTGESSPSLESGPRTRQTSQLTTRRSSIFNIGNRSRNRSKEVLNSDGTTTPRRGSSKQAPLPDGIETAGNPIVYVSAPGDAPFIDHMIRERISTKGIRRPLEPEDQLPACTLPLEEVGIFNEKSVKRYLHGQNAWDLRFKGVAKAIEKAREKSVEIADRKDLKRLQKLKMTLSHTPGEAVKRRRSRSPSPTGAAASDLSDSEEEGPSCQETFHAAKVLGSRQWDWGWALHGEDPPPSSIVSRRDTEEARRLGRFADKLVGPGEGQSFMSGTKLWQVIMESLSDSDKGTPATVDEKGEMQVAGPSKEVQLREGGDRLMVPTVRARNPGASRSALRPLSFHWGSKSDPGSPTNSRDDEQRIVEATLRQKTVKPPTTTVFSHFFGHKKTPSIPKALTAPAQAESSTGKEAEATPSTTNTEPTALAPVRILANDGIEMTTSPIDSSTSTEEHGPPHIQILVPEVVVPTVASTDDPSSPRASRERAQSKSRSSRPISTLIPGGSTAQSPSSTLRPSWFRSMFSRSEVSLPTQGSTT